MWVRGSSFGGHDIPERKIRERYLTSRRNLVTLLPQLKELTVVGNSITVGHGQPLSDLQLVLHWRDGSAMWPENEEQLRQTPDWAKPIVEAALSRNSG